MTQPGPVLFALPTTLCSCLHMESRRKWSFLLLTPPQSPFHLSALLPAIEAMKKAYQEELSRELSKTQSLPQGPDGLQKQHQ